MILARRGKEGITHGTAGRVSLQLAPGHNEPPCNESLDKEQYENPAARLENLLRRDSLFATGIVNACSTLGS